MSYRLMISGWAHLAESADEEYDRALSKFPGANNNLLALCEEHGELVKAALDLGQGKSTKDEVEKELIQVMAMCLRLWFQGDKTIGLEPICGCKHNRA